MSEGQHGCEIGLSYKALVGDCRSRSVEPSLPVLMARGNECRGRHLLSIQAESNIPRAVLTLWNSAWDRLTLETVPKSALIFVGIVLANSKGGNLSIPLRFSPVEDGPIISWIRAVGGHFGRTKELYCRVFELTRTEHSLKEFYHEAAR